MRCARLGFASFLLSVLLRNTQSFPLPRVHPGSSACLGMRSIIRPGNNIRMLPIVGFLPVTPHPSAASFLTPGGHTVLCVDTWTCYSVPWLMLLWMPSCRLGRSPDYLTDSRTDSPLKAYFSELLSLHRTRTKGGKRDARLQSVETLTVRPH